ncbi:MAG: T9SS type A sorting domain-containing protein [Bacteroidales bacterium]|nr:T9SS type A sorting domain-containing protein [Bacteroidales bacterium]
MKKILLLLLIASLSLNVGAQYEQSKIKGPRLERVEIHPGYVSDYSGAVVGQKLYDNVTIGTTWYDAQSMNYGNAMQRMWAYDDGTVGASWTCAGQDLVPNRGIGYNYYDGTEWGTPDLHVGPEDRHGTTCYSPWGENGEIACTYQYVANESPIHFFRREMKGEGDWIQTSLYGPADVSLVWQSMATSGPNLEYIHLLAYTYDTEYMGQPNALLYYRSDDGGESWTDGVIIDGLGEDYIESINALSYNWSNPVGNNIAFTYGFDEWGGWVFKSPDNGDTWERITVMESPFDPFDPPTDTEVFGLSIGSSSVALDSDAKAHVVFSRMLQVIEGGAWGYYPLNSDGLIYWNEDMEPLDTTIISSTGLQNLEDGGYLCSYVFGYDPSVGVEIPSGQPNYANAMCGFPVISIDAQDNIFVSSSNIAPEYSNGEHLYRHIIANSSFDGGLTWNGMIDLNDDIQFIFSECAFPVMSPVVDNTIYFLFQADGMPGTFEWPNEQAEAVENEMIMMSVPKSVFVGIDENENVLNFELSDLYPNPANSSVLFNVSLEGTANVQVQLTNMTGQKVQSIIMGNLSQGSHRINLDVSDMTAGIYNVVVIVDGQTAGRKLIVH